MKRKGTKLEKKEKELLAHWVENTEKDCRMNSRDWRYELNVSHALSYICVYIYIYLITVFPVHCQVCKSRYIQGSLVAVTLVAYKFYLIV